MKCYFCQEELKMAPRNGSVTIPAHCFHHRVPVLHKLGEASGRLMTVSYFIKVGKKEYEVDIRLYESRTVINLVKTYLLPSDPPPPSPPKGSRAWGNGNSYSTATRIKSFDCVLDISPENAHLRIPTILVFS